MLECCTLILCLIVQVLSAPQNGNINIPNSDSPLDIPDNPNVKEIIKPTTPAPIEEKKVDPLVLVASLPSSPINVTDSAKPCASCGKGPLLACPKDDAECGSGEACCYDSCRARQVCRPKSEILGYKEPNKRFQKRETDTKLNSKSTEVELISARQNIDDSIPLDEDYGTFNVHQGAFSPSFSKPENLASNQESLSVFASTGGGDREAEVVPPSDADFYNQFQQNPFSQYSGFDEEIPFVFNQAPQPLIPVQQPVIIPHQYIPDDNEDDDEGGFFDSLFG